MSTPRAWKQEAADLRKAVEKERGAAEAAEAEAASLREALDGERRAVRALRRDLQRQLKAAREAEATKTNDLLQQLRNKLTLELTEAVKNEREAAIKSTTAELQRLHQAQETELRKEFSRKEEDLRRQLRDALAHSRHPDASADTLQTSAKQAMAAPCPPAADVLALRALNKRLETRMQELEEAERRNADAVRSQYEEHSMREAEQQKMARRETHLLLEKLKSRDRSIENLEREITTLKGRLDETRNVRDRFDSEKPGESPRLGIKRPNTRNSGLPPEAMRARSSRMKDNNSNELNDEQQSCKNSKPLIPKTEVDGPKDDKKDFKLNITDDELIRHTTDIDKKEDKEIQTDTDEKPCIYKECSTNTDEEGLDSWTRAVGLETLYQVVVREHQDLQRAHQALLAKLKAEQRARLDLEAPIKIREENPINLALAAQIEELTAKQEELISENHDLREQNDLLEFRLLEMDSAPASLHFKTAPASPSRSPESRGGGDREVDDVSDSGVLSLPTSEDISEADFHDLAMEPSSRDIKFKLAQLCLSIENVTDKVSIQQGLSLLRHYEVRLETALNTLSQDSLSVRSLTSPDSVISSETSKSQSRIIATVLPFTDLSQSCGKQKDDVPLKKLFKDADCLQESGIFEDSPEYCSRFTQTDCSSAKLETPGDLSLEIRKLKQIQERIEEQGSNKRLLRTNVNEANNGLSTESKELAFYRDRVEMLENKLAIYESSGDEQVKKMNLRLDREILLSAEIKHLKERCRMLEELNRNLEEEKCEFEEAENDTRLRCQKLEVKLSALGEKKSDLQVQLQQNARTMSNLRSCLAEEERKRIEARQHASRMENLVQHYEQRNFELEEKEIESRCRAQMLEKTIPALKVYNTWKVANAICNSAGENRNSHNNNRSGKMIMSPSEVGCDGGNDGAKSNQNRKGRSIRSSLLPSYEKEIGDQCNTNVNESSSVNESGCIDQNDDYEDYLHDRIKQLELAIKCKEELQLQSLSPEQKHSLISKIQELKKTNCDLECRLKDLEMKEGYYKQTLQQADEMWANMEGGYKQQLRELENKLDDKQNEIYEFEAMVRKLSSEKEMRQQLQERTCSLESEMKDYRFKIAEKECERKLLEKERLRLFEELEHTNEEFNYLKHVIEPSLRQQLEQHKKMTKELKLEIESLEKDREQEIEDRLAEVSGLKRKMNKLGKELLENECTIGELREEVQTLEMAVIELREKLEDVHDKHEREVMKMAMEIDDKNREIQLLYEKSACEIKLPKSARQELEEAERQMQNSKDPSTSVVCDQKPPKRHRKHKVISPHSTLRKLNEKIRAGLLKDDKKVLKNFDSLLGGEHQTDNIILKTDSIPRVPADSLLAEIRDSTSAIDVRTLPQSVEVFAAKCVDVESGFKNPASTSSSSAIELKEDKELHVDGQSTESTPNSNSQPDKEISEKLYKHYQTDSSFTESDEPFITPPQTPERKKRSDSHGRNNLKDHKKRSKTNQSKSSSHSKSSSMDSTQILICDDCLLNKKFLLACISCGRDIEEGGEGFSSYRASTSLSDLEEEETKSSQHVPGVNKSHTQSGTANEKNENASPKNGSDAVGPDHKLGDDRVEKTDGTDENRDLEGKDNEDHSKSHEDEETNSSKDKDTGSDRKDKDDKQTKDESERSDRKDNKDSDSKDDDNKDDNDDDDNDDDDNGDSSSKDPNNRNSNSKDKDDDDGEDNNRGNSFQGNNGDGANENAGGKDENSDNQSESNSNQAGKSVDGSDKKGDSSVDDAVKENSVSGRDQENSSEAEGSSKRKMDLETFYVFMNPAMVSNHLFKTPVPDVIPIYKPRYYDSTLVRTTDLLDGGASTWYPPVLPYPTFKDLLLKRIIDGHDLRSFGIAKSDNTKKETTSINNSSISQDRKLMDDKKAEDDMYHLSNHIIKLPPGSKLNDNREQFFCYNQDRTQFASVPSKHLHNNSNKLDSRDCVGHNETATKVTSEKLIELLINEDFRPKNKNSGNTLLENQKDERNCVEERKKSCPRNNDTSFKNSLLSLLAFDNNSPKTESQKSDSKMLEKSDSDESKGHKNSKIERTLFQSSNCKARATRESMKTSEICNKDEELSFQEVKNMKTKDEVKRESMKTSEICNRDEELSFQEVKKMKTKDEVKRESMKTSEISNRDEELSFQEAKKMQNHNFKLDLEEAPPKMSFENANTRTQSCRRNELENFREKFNDSKLFDLVDYGGANMNVKKELHERENNLNSTKNKAGKVSPAPSSNSLVMHLINIMDGVYLKLFNEILIRSFENSSISLGNHVVILKLYKNSLSSMLNNKIDCQKNLKNCDEIEKGLSGILKCFVTSKGVEVVGNLVSRFLLQLRKPYRKESDLYVQNMNPITFVANYMESVEIIVVGLVARQITRLLKSVSIRKTDKILGSFLNQLNLLKPILGVSNAKNENCDAVAEEIQELVLFFLEGICDPSNMQEALELVNIHLAMIENMKLLKTRKGKGNFLREYLSENMSNIGIPTHSNVNKNSKSEKMFLEEIQQFKNTDHDVITNSSHKEIESLCFKNVSNSMIDFRKLKKALGLTLKHVTDVITANELEKLFSYYKDICEKLLCEHCTPNPDLKQSFLEFEGEIKFILQFIDRQFVGIIQNIDCEISRACLLVDLEYIFDDHIRILKFLVTEIIVTNENRSEETLTCFRSEIVLDSTTVQNNTRVQPPLSEKKENKNLNFAEKNTSSRDKGKTNAKNHETKLPSSTKHKNSNDSSRLGRAKSKSIQDSNKIAKNELILIGKSINLAREQPQCLSKGSNNKTVSPTDQTPIKSNEEKGSNNENPSNNGSSENPNSNAFLDVNGKSDKLGTGTSELDENKTSQVGISPSFDLFCFIPNTLLTNAQTCGKDSNLKFPSGFKQCSFIDDPNLELAKKVLHRSLNRLARSYDRADLNSYLECLLIEIDHFLEPEHRTKTHYIENSVHPDLSQFLPRTVFDIKKFLIQCASRANKEQEEIGTLKNEITQYILLYCKSEIISCSRNGQTDSVVNLSALPSISVDGLRVSYKIIENRDLRENSDELLKQVPSRILNSLDQSDYLSSLTTFKPPSANLNETSCVGSTRSNQNVIDLEEIGTKKVPSKIFNSLDQSDYLSSLTTFKPPSANLNETSCLGSTSSNQNIIDLEEIGTKKVPSKIFNSLDQSDVLPPSTNFKLSSIDLNEKSCLGSTSSNQNNIYVEDIETSTQSVLNYSHLKNDDEITVDKICEGIKDYFNHCKSTMTQSMYKSFSSKYLENILSSLQTTENNHDKADQKIEVDIKDYFNHCKSSMTQDNYESFSSHYFENILESLNTHRKSLETIDVPQEYRNQQVYTVVEEIDRPQEENVVKEKVIAEGVNSHTASVDRGKIVSQILSSVVDDLAMDDQDIKTNTHVKLRDKWEDLCSLECHWPVIMKYRVGNYLYGFDQIGECDVECSEPIRMKYPLASDSRRKQKSSDVLEGEEENSGGLRSLLNECLNKIKYEERMDNMKALLKSLIEYGHPPTSEDESMIVTDDVTARTIDKSNEEAQEKPCCDVCPIYCPCCIYNKNNPSSEFFIKNLQKDLKSKLDSLSGENENASSLAENKNLDDVEENNVEHSIEEEIVKQFIMESANDLYEKHHLPKDSDSPDHKKEDLGETESRENNDSINKQPEEIADENVLDRLDGRVLNSRLDEIHEDPHTDKKKDQSHYNGLKEDDVENHLDNSDKIDNNALESDNRSNPSRDEMENPELETGSLENSHISDDKHEVIQELGEHEINIDNGSSTGGTGEPSGEVGNAEQDGLEKNIGNEAQRDNLDKKETEAETSFGKSQKPFDNTGDKNDTNLIKDSQNIPKDVREGDTEGEFESSDVNENSKNEDLPSKGVSKENDTSRSKPIDEINSGGGEPACSHDRNCPHRRMNNLPDLKQPCENDGDFEPPSVISLLSSLNILKNKVIVKDQIIQCLADQLVQMAQEGCLWKNDMLECISSHPSKRYVDFDSAMVADYLAGYVYEKPNKQPCVYVNDELVERIRDPDGLATIVSNLDTKFVNLITVVMLDPDCIHCLMDTICISAANIKKQNKIATYYQALESEDENNSSLSREEDENDSSSSSSEDVPNVNRKVTVEVGSKGIFSTQTYVHSLDKG